MDSNSKIEFFAPSEKHGPSRGIVIEKEENGICLIKYAATYWRARPLDSMEKAESLSPGDLVCVVGRQGITLLFQTEAEYYNENSTLTPKKNSTKDISKLRLNTDRTELTILNESINTGYNQLPQASIPSFLWMLFERLRRRGFPLGLGDYEALKLALQAGFGWSSQAALGELCASLWAKSLREQETLLALFNQLAPLEEAWQLDEKDQKTIAFLEDINTKTNKRPETEESEDTPKVSAQQGLPPIFLGDVTITERPFLFEPQFPLSYREVAQAWRRLRRPVRTGPLIELDLERTIEQRCKAGVATSVVLRPRRSNVARLLLLVDRQGSMTPFHRFCDEVCTAIRQAGRFEETALYYFHNVPAEGAEEDVLGLLEDTLYPSLDPILPQITPLIEGNLYIDSSLLRLKPLLEVLDQQARGASVVIISDAGAGRGQYRISRLLDTLAFLKGLKRYTPHFVWINPLAQRYWPNSTAAYLSRHIPMFSLDRDGMYQSVNVLRGQQFTTEKPI
ncbi:VWA domain-containing protein [Leptolyngbya sp. CCNP1308]|uniref:VWA domain-containing protein n=1 Tax=Leptolyngbya sp. CCNP1308 TaxID=3110255 RepID=UPI002B1EE665|nr:VWA domain-containing protein [Leptolyngbya sp. CCNP1308]MEA5452533.1 VWA domain-containing protein [Leptolyngbya sp. CCNP1308]